MQMQAYAACEDEEIREAVRDEMLRLVSFVQSASGASDGPCGSGWPSACS